MPLPRVRVSVQLDKPRTLVLDFNAYCRVEEVTGVSLLVGQLAFTSMRVMRAIVWAGLLHEDPTLSLEFVGDLLQDADAEVVLGKIYTAYGFSLPDLDEDEEGESNDSDPPSPPTGETSGPPEDTTSD